MLKFFRKYNKMLLAVFMTLLMIVFVGGSALQAVLTPSANQVVAETRLGPISYSDQQRANAMTGWLEVMGLDWRRRFSAGGEPLEIIDWILLQREAAKMGIQPEPEAVRAAMISSGGLDRLQRTAAELRVKVDHILEAMAEYNAVQVLAGAIASAAAPSEAEIRSLAHDMLSKTRVHAVVLPASAFIDEAQTFPEERVQSQYEAYRDAEPGDGLTFGYHVPPAVRVQYIKISRDDIAHNVRIANLERKAEKYYREHHSTDPEFLRSSDEDLTDEEAEAQADEQAGMSPYFSWEESQDIAIAAVKRQKAEEAASAIADWLLQYDSEEWIGADRNDAGYKTAPENVAKLPYYEKIVSDVPATINYPEAISVHETDFFFKEDARTVPYIGGVSLSLPTRGLQTFGDLAFRSEGVIPSVPEDAGSQASDYLAHYQTCPYVLKDLLGNVYLFRVIETKPAHVPEDLQEVRDRVVADLRLLAAYDEAKDRAVTLRNCTQDVDLKQAYENDEALTAISSGRGGFFDSGLVSRLTESDLRQPELPDRTYVGGGIGWIPRSYIDQWFALEYAEPPSMVQELPDRASVMVVEWIETQPARIDEFESMRTRVATAVRGARSDAAISDWFDPDQIRARNEFKLLR